MEMELVSIQTLVNANCHFPTRELNANFQSVMDLLPTILVCAVVKVLAFYQTLVNAILDIMEVNVKRQLVQEFPLIHPLCVVEMEIVQLSIPVNATLVMDLLQRVKCPFVLAI